MAHKKSKLATNKKKLPISDYDELDISSAIDTRKPLKFSDLGLKLPEHPPTQVVSIRLPTELLNQIKALGSQHDVPYQALIKLFLARAVKKKTA